MASTRLEFLLTTKDQASSTLRNVSKEIATVKREASTDVSLGGLTRAMSGLEAQAGNLSGLLSGGLMGLGAAAGVAGVAMLTGQIMEMGRAAANVELVRQQFDSLAASVGASSTTMIKAMREASGGMIADTELMLAANRAMALGVADTSEEMAQLVQLAIARGSQLGLSAQQAFDDLVTGIGRESKMILDNLGIIIDTEAAVDNYAATVGKTADQLTAVERKQALVNEILKQTPDAARQAAAAIESQNGSFQRWDASLKNASETWGTVFLPALAGGLDILTEVVDKLGGLASALSGGERRGADEIRALIAEQEALIAEYSDPNKYFQSNVTEAGIAQAKDQIAMLTIELGMVETASANAAASQAQLAQDSNAAAGGMSDATAASGGLTSGLARLAGQSDATASALRSMWVNAAGALGSAQALAGWQSQQRQLEALNDLWTRLRLTPDQIEFERAVWLERQNTALDNQIDALTDVGAAAGRAAGGGLRSFDDRLSSIRSSVSGIVQESLSLDDIAWPGQEGGQRQDAINENARRLAAIANEGLIGQDWLGQFAEEAPGTYADLMLKIASGMDARGAAQQLLAEFQQGLRPDLLDFEQIKQRVRDQLTSQQAIAAMTEDLTSQLVAELGVSAGDVQAAMAELGLGGGEGTGGGTSMSVTPKIAIDSASIQSAAVAASSEFAAGMNAGTVADKFSSSFMISMKDFYLRFYASGAASANEYNNGFLAQFKANVPVEIVLALATLVTPEVLAAIDARNGRTGATP